MEPLELAWNSLGTPLNTLISLSFKKIYMYIKEEFQEFHKPISEKINNFSLTSHKRVTKIKGTSLELLELQIYQKHKSLNYRIHTTTIGVPKPMKLDGWSSKKLRNSKAVSEVKQGIKTTKPASRAGL